MGSAIVTVGFVIWPELTRTQSLNHAIKNRPTVHHYKLAMQVCKNWNSYSISMVISSLQQL